MAEGSGSDAADGGPGPAEAGRRMAGPRVWARVKLGATVAIATVCAAACATSGAGVGEGVGRPSDTLPGPGLGTLTQSEISVVLTSGGVRLLVTPLSEAVTRTATLETHRRLSEMGAAFAGNATPGGVLFLVSVFADDGGEFFPDEVGVISKGRRFRPQRILPVTPGWGRGRVDPRETEMAVMAFDSELDLEEALTFVYRGQRVGDWASILQRVQSERIRMRVRGRPWPEMLEAAVCVEE